MTVLRWCFCYSLFILTVSEALYNLLFLGSLVLTLCVWGEGGGDDCVWFLFCTVVLCVLSSFSITSLRKRELISLLLLCSDCCCASVSVLCIFLAVLLVGLGSVIVVFPVQTYLLFGI